MRWKEVSLFLVLTFGGAWLAALPPGSSRQLLPLGIWPAFLLNGFIVTDGLAADASRPVDPLFAQLPVWIATTILVPILWRKRQIAPVSPSALQPSSHA